MPLKRQRVKMSPTTSKEIIKGLNCWAFIVDSEDSLYQKIVFFGLALA